MIFDKKLIYDDRTSISDDDDTDECAANHMKKKPKKTILDDEDKKFFHLPTNLLCNVFCIQFQGCCQKLLSLFKP